MKHLKKLKELCSDFNVLIVDDEEKELHNFEVILKTLFKSVTTAKNGLHALKKYNNEIFDLVITDISMPKMDGFELIKEIRKINLMQRVIILSANSEVSYLSKAIVYNVDGYIFKPLEINQMIDAIKRAIRIIVLEKQNREYQYNLEQKVKEQVLEIDEYSKKLISQLLHSKVANLPNKQKLQLDFEKSNFKELILIDIDNFENINLAYGFEDGNKIIKLVAEFLSGLVTNHKVYHLYGDEFLIAVKSNRSESATEIANLIKEKIYIKSFNLTNNSVRITFTFGIVDVTHEDSVPYNKLNMAIKEIRKISKNSIGYYNENSLAIEKQKYIQEYSQKIKIALDLDQLQVFYQPIYDLKKSMIVKYECLVRIIEGDRVITPIQLLESAKISGFLSNITRRVINKAFEYFSATDTLFSINITDDDLKENYLKKYLQDACAKYNISPQNVILEVLENISDYDARDAVAQLQEIRDFGFSISIDDFGADSSNFSRVQQLSIDFLKIDGLFIKDIDTNKNSLDIVSTIIYYAKKSDLQTIAEFVHSQEIFDIVKNLGVDFVQGYYIGKPKRDIVRSENVTVRKN